MISQCHKFQLTFPNVTVSRLISYTIKFLDTDHKMKLENYFQKIKENQLQNKWLVITFRSQILNNFFLADIY